MTVHRPKEPLQVGLRPFVFATLAPPSVWVALARNDAAAWSAWLEAASLAVAKAGTVETFVTLTAPPASPQLRADERADPAFCAAFDALAARADTEARLAAELRRDRYALAAAALAAGVALGALGCLAALVATGVWVDVVGFAL